jgi:hypothetical protein
MQALTYVLARVLVAFFCWITAGYAFVASSAFAYQQFIRPRVFRWVGDFSDWHVALSWGWLMLLTGLLRRDLRSRAGKVSALLFVAAAAATGLNTLHPILPRLTDGSWSIAAGIAALVPVIWLALIDHQLAGPWLRVPARPLTEAERRVSEGRRLLAALGAALAVAVVYSVMASLGVARAFEPDLMGPIYAVVVGVAAGDVLLVFTGAFLLLTLLGRLMGRWFIVHYYTLLATAALACAAAVALLVGPALGLTPKTAWLCGGAFGMSAAATWSGLRIRGLAASGQRVGDAADVFFPRYAGEGGDRRAMLACAAIAPLAVLLAAVASRMDWDSVLLRAGVLVVWAAAFIALCAAVHVRRPVTNQILGVVCAAPLILHAAIPMTPVLRHALDRYGIYNASSLLADAMVRRPPETPSFGRYLRANTGLTDVTVDPISIDLVPSPLPAASRTPLIFLLVIDSLRPDYLSPYNPRVHFTPHIQAFADSNLLFSNAFTRYGGTGLSMPAIWAGSALAHKQYVIPFASMNSLERLLDRNGYRRAMSRDHITDLLWQRRPSDIELDRGHTEMDFEFCRTLDEIGGTLESTADSPEPLFVQTRSLNLHVASVRNGYVPPGKAYEGFEAPYAWRVEQMDECFGAFIDRLKRLGLYDRSLIVLTSDHGELIGEDGRWGHSYHMFPEVVQIPLLLHLPASIPPGSVNTDALSLSTDIVPTVYRALGYQPGRLNALAGRSLIDVGPARAVGPAADGEVLAASYGAVYAVVSRSGRYLYIADAIKGTDHAYRRSPDRTWTELAVDDLQRAEGQRRIRRHVDEAARRYGLDRRF